ncbi:Rof/RNase P-like protein [Gloeopeniophorella convolvens]|nr:Rof/RNase P-like protein [Gloeopeniophorella convolvens]
MAALYQPAILDNPPTPDLTRATFTSANPYTPTFVHETLAPQTGPARAHALYNERVRRRQLLLASKPRAPKPKKSGADPATARVKLGRRAAAEKGVWRLRPEEARWALFVPLHRLWLGYMSELLGLAAPRDAAPSAGAMPQAAGMHAKLVKADFHGALLTGAVRRSKNAALVGLAGIVVQETENTFRVVTRADKLKLVPKQGAVFAFAVPLCSTLGVSPVADATATVLDAPHIEFELYGNQFRFRAADRASRKFKHKETIEL